jgi:hypothetical protein
MRSRALEQLAYAPREVQDELLSDSKPKPKSLLYTESCVKLITVVSHNRGTVMPGGNPFPLLSGGETPFPWVVTVKQQVTGRWVKGKGSYLAVQIGPFVELVATGTLNYLNAEARLVKSPLTIFPPIYGLFFFIPEIGLPAQKPFTVTASFFSEDPVKSVTVYDADGEHDVPVVQALP